MLEEFKVFAAVASHLSVTKASIELHMSQSAVSKHLRLLEEGYKLQLYRKGRTGIELTETGELFLRHITPILEQVEQLNETFHASRGPVQEDFPARHLNIGAGYGQVAVLLPLLLSLYNKKYRDVEVNIRTGSVDRQIQRLATGEVDVAILGRKIPAPRFVNELVREENLVMFVRPGHPLVKKPQVTLGNVAPYPLVLGGSHRRTSGGEKAVKVLNRSGSDLKVIMRSESVETIKATVKTTNNIGILYRDALLPELRKREFIAVHPPGFDFKGQSYLVFSAGGPRSQEATDFLDTVRCWRDKCKLRRSGVWESALGGT